MPLSVAAALVLVDLSSSTLPGGGAFLLLLLPVILSATLLGRDHGIVALVFGAGGAVLLVPLRGHPWLSDPVDLALLVLYLGIGTTVIVTTSGFTDRRGRRPSPAPPDTRRARSGPVEPLTARELDVLCLAAQGRSLEQIGRQLYRSRNRAQAIAAGLSTGLLDPATFDRPD
jgi:DNA-binding CsgD family transcriptional regulator